MIIEEVFIDQIAVLYVLVTTYVTYKLIINYLSNIKKIKELRLRIEHIRLINEDPVENALYYEFEEELNYILNINEIATQDE